MLQYIGMENKISQKEWGYKTADGSEIWDSEPIFKNESVTFKDQLKLFFYLKKFMLFGWLKKNQPKRILDVGCGTGAAMIEMKKLFGRGVEIVGVDVVKMQVDLANQKIKKNGVWAEAFWYDGEHLPFPDESFDAIYTSDVLGHVQNVKGWLKDLNRVLKSGGTLAMFSESKPGKHAFIRNYLLKRGLNVDPHAEYHISLYGKAMLKEFLEASGFEVKKMYSVFWAKFLAHPEELYSALQNQNRFFVLKNLNKLFFWLKKKLHPYSTAFWELYGLLEMFLVGRWLESQGYVILGRKK